ncbi:hypothetical protein [Parabacteroides goldsteinii]|uniref:hypothetical protein n=1 Tax=Parabacteroides goldsteinii TaxID=328812 RepID=UPI00259B0D09|nr:hypothetical protein [Parabacteroides goldsteinii]
MKLPSVWKSWYLRPSGSCRKFPSLTIKRLREGCRVFAASGAEIQGFEYGKSLEARGKRGCLGCRILTASRLGLAVK